jgi:hypothetical protein
MRQNKKSNCQAELLDLFRKLGFQIFENNEKIFKSAFLKIVKHIENKLLAKNINES